jgi:hypothetical protein
MRRHRRPRFLDKSQAAPGPPSLGLTFARRQHLTSPGHSLPGKFNSQAQAKATSAGEELLRGAALGIYVKKPPYAN